VRILVRADVSMGFCGLYDSISARALINQKSLFCSSEHLFLAK